MCLFRTIYIMNRAKGFQPEWLKIPVESQIVFAGRNYLCVGGGCYLLVYALPTGQQHIFTALGRNGDGINCYTGHRQLPVLAFAEKCFSPKIIIMTCPEFNHLITLTGGYEDVVALSFSNQEYLVSFSNLPCCKITVWNWRTQEKLVSECSGSRNSLKQLSCSFHSPVSVVQLQLPHCSELFMWDIHYSYKRCLLVKHTITLPREKFAVNATWNTEGALFILDNKGFVYMLNTDYELDVIIEGSGIGTEMPCFAWYKGGLIVMDTNLDVKHFIKKAGKFINDWSVSPVKMTQLISNPTKEILIGWSAEGQILELDIDKHIFIKKANYGCNFVDICFINPTHEYFATLSKDNNIGIWSPKTAEMVGKLKVFEKVTAMNSSPIYPYVAIGLECGKLQLLSLCDPTVPKCFVQFFLSQKPITHIKFNEKGNIIVTANLHTGLFFLIKGVPGTHMEIINNICYDKCIADFCITEDRFCYKLYLLVAKENHRYAGAEVVLKFIPKNETKISKCKYSSNKLYTHLIVRNNIFYAKDILSRSISTITFAKRTFFVKDSIKSGHLMRCISLNADNYHIYTSGYDGIVIIRSLDLKEVLTVLTPHHRNDCGVHKVIVDQMRRYVVTLGRDGTMICTKVKHIDLHMEQQSIENERKLLNLKQMFEKGTAGYVLEAKYAEKAYLEMKMILKLEEETKAFSEIRKNLNEEFQSLKNEVINLLETNLNGPENERIDIIEFYLHKKLKEHKEKEAIKNCEHITKHTHTLIQAQNKVWQWMIYNFWDTMTIKRSIICGIFSNFYVENYSSYPADEQRYFKFKCVQMEREFEDMVSANNVLKVWLPKSKSGLQNELSKGLHVLNLDDTYNFTGKLSIFGRALQYPTSEAFEFLQICLHAYNEEEIHTYGQIHFTKTILHINSREMRQYFNDAYAKVMEMKKQQMNIIKKNNERLRFILSEMNLRNTDIIDPEWKAEETPENIIEVKDDEVDILPYVSPDVQQQIDEKETEAERIRLFLHGDDSRDVALENMMHGVLEMRWEDTLKRDVPVPKCMLEKSPDEYNTDDLLIISEYEKQVELLEKERLRYREMLKQEYNQVSEDVRETIRSFNRNLHALLHLKIRIEKARLQETLAFKRMQVECRERIFYNEEEQNLIINIKTNETNLQKTQLKLCQVQEAANECRIANEQLLAREKQLEKNFKRDVQDCSSVVQEQAMKLYKKNPKMQIRSAHCASVLVELGGCSLSQEKSRQKLTPECLEYLRSLDNLDLHAGVPNTIDEILYKNICRHRRLRLENELRVKANTLEQADIDISVQTYQKMVVSSKEKLNKLKIDLQKFRKKKLEVLHNKQVQVILEQGMVEVPLTGLLSDFDNVIVVCRTEVENVNKAILKAGENKLNVMQQKMVHRRSIILKEWEHEKLRMEIEDLEDHLNTIKTVKMTKEIRTYIEQTVHSKSTDKSLSLALDEEIQAYKESYKLEIVNRRKDIAALEKEKKTFMKKNKELDEKIASLNADICELSMQLNSEVDKHNKHETEKRMALIIKRSKLVKQIQEQQNEILVLQTELELLKLKTYPTLKFKTQG